MFEYHSHTTNSPDSRVTMAQYCERAIDRGVREVAFTDHIDHDPAVRSRGHYNYERYRNDIAACRALYGEHLTILAAAEIDWNRGTAAAVADYLVGKQFDFVIASVHWVNGEYVGERAKTHSSIETYAQFLDEVEALVTTEDFFNVIGHFDLGKRYHQVNGRMDIAHNHEQLARIFTAMAAKGKGFDLNTSSLRNGSTEPMPGPDILRFFRECGGQHVTIGADAHSLDAFATNIEAAVRTLEEAGWTTASHIAQGKLVQVPLARVLGETPAVIPVLV